MEIKFELNDGCLGMIPVVVLVTSYGGFGIISVQRDLLELMFIKSIPENFVAFDKPTFCHVHAWRCR